ncbi:hxxee motif protein [Cystoisospora suis]|uniref:Hxxee motif protein n=1 Tax=Cystoisospora suis TaxID=483139 RepID=A0A2C6L4S2_9APIC|nr:hxxee motif protein [Cystoisospora suis]
MAEYSQIPSPHPSSPPPPGGGSELSTDLRSTRRPYGTGNGDEEGDHDEKEGQGETEGRSHGGDASYSYPQFQDKRGGGSLFREPSASDTLLSPPRGLRLAMETDQQNAFVLSPPPYRSLDQDNQGDRPDDTTFVDVDTPRNHHLTGCTPDTEEPTIMPSLEMKRIIWSALWMLSLFLTLSPPGLPFGKYNINWSDVLPLLYRWPGIFYACGYLLLFYIFAGYGSIVTPRSWLAVGPALLCFHLFEEHGLNGLDARRSPFKNYFNEALKNQFGESAWATDFLSDASLMWTSFLHTLGVSMLAMWQGPWYGTGILAFGLTLVDGFLHILVFVFSGFSYNPGFFSAFLLCVPSSLYYFQLLNRCMLENTKESFFRVLGLGVSVGFFAYFLLTIAILCRLPSITYIAAYIPPLAVALVQFHTFQKYGGSPRWAELW